MGRQRYNRTLIKMIKSYIKEDKTEWDLYLGCLGAAYRSSIHESTGLTPNLLMLGREVRLPSEIIFGSKMRFQDENIVNYGLYVEVLRDRIQRAHHMPESTNLDQMKDREISII